MTIEISPSPELDAGDLPVLAPQLQERSMFCLHGIALDSVGLNSVLPAETSLEERFTIAIQNRPALSTSVHTERATTNQAPLWSSVGVVIGDGTIQAAGSCDMSSVMLADGQRQTPEQQPDEIAAALDQIAANDEKWPDYPPLNEVVIADPVITGLYFKDTAGLYPHQINRTQPTAPPNTVPELIIQAAAKYALPVYAVRFNGVHQVNEFDATTGRYRFSANAAPQVHANEVLPHAQFHPQTISFAGRQAVEGEL